MADRALIWSPDAIRDLEEIADYIAMDKPVAARRWARTLVAAAEHAAALPFAGRRVPELERDDMRELIKRGTPAFPLLVDLHADPRRVAGHRRGPPQSHA